MSSGSGSSSRRSLPRGSSSSPTPTTSRTSETRRDANRASRDLLRESVRLINCAGRSARTAKLAIRSASYSLRPAPNLVCSSSISLGSAANCFRASSQYLSALAPLPNSPVHGLFVSLNRSASSMCMGVRQLRAPMSPVTRAMQSTANLLTIAAASLEKAAVAGEQAESQRLRGDRTRSRSPHLATPIDGDATRYDSVAAEDAAALDDTPRAGASGVATPRAGCSGVGTPRAGGSGVATPRAGGSGVATPRAGGSGVATPRAGGSGVVFPRAGSSGDGTPQDANLKFSHILIKHKNSRRPVDNEDRPVTRTKDQAMELVIDLHEQITRDLITFADAAVAFSECTSARHEGDIHSRFKRGRMQKSFQNAALALGPGTISNIIETNSGYHIIQRAQPGPTGDSHRHRRHRTRSRSPRLATPRDGDAAPTDAKPRHSTPRGTKARDSAGRNAMARDSAGRDAVTRDGAGRDAVARDGRDRDAVARDGAARDAVAPDGTDRDAVARDGAVRDAVARDGAGRNAVPRDGAGRDAIAHDAVARDGAVRDAVPRDGPSRDAVARDGAGREAVVQDTTERDVTPCYGAFLDGASGDGAFGDGASDDGASDDGASDDGASGDGGFGDGVPSHKASVNGTPNDGPPQDGKSNLKFSHILIKHKDSRRPVDVRDKPVTRTKAEAMDLVIEVHERISQDLVTFADAAASFSDCASAQSEGDIQCQFNSGRVQRSFEAVALALIPGQISHIIESKSGYHILQRRE